MTVITVQEFVCKRKGIFARKYDVRIEACKGGIGYVIAVHAAYASLDETLREESTEEWHLMAHRVRTEKRNGTSPASTCAPNRLAKLPSKPGSCRCWTSFRDL